MGFGAFFSCESEEAELEHVEFTVHWDLKLERSGRGGQDFVDGPLDGFSGLILVCTVLKSCETSKKDRFAIFIIIKSRFKGIIIFLILSNDFENNGVSSFCICLINKQDFDGIAANFICILIVKTRSNSFSVIIKSPWNVNVSLVIVVWNSLDFDISQKWHVMVLIFVWQYVKRIENSTIGHFVALESVNGENVFVRELVAHNNNWNFHTFDNALRKFDSNFYPICSDILDCQTVVQ